MRRRRLIGCECESGRDEEETLVAPTAHKETRAELTARHQFQCEAESMLGATVTRGRYSVNINTTH